MVHRLDREAQGLILFAYTKNAASVFSELWQKHDVRKFYKVEVLGVIKSAGEINEKLEKNTKQGGQRPAEENRRAKHRCHLNCWVRARP